MYIPTNYRLIANDCNLIQGRIQDFWIGGAEPLMGARGRSPRIFLKTIGVLVPLRAILAIEGPTKLMLKFPEITIVILYL